MTAFALTVTASFDAARSTRDGFDRLQTRPRSGDGRTFNAHGARAVAVERFLADAARARIEAPETILGATRPPR